MKKYYKYNKTSSLISQHVLLLVNYKEHELHRQRLGNIRSSFNFERANSQIRTSKRLLQNNFKRNLLIEEECNKVLKDNQILLQKIMEIDRRRNMHLGSDQPPFVESLNIGIIKKKYQEINQENFVILNIIVEITAETIER